MKINAITSAILSLCTTFSYSIVAQTISLVDQDAERNPVFNYWKMTWSKNYQNEKNNYVLIGNELTINFGSLPTDDVYYLGFATDMFYTETKWGSQLDEKYSKLTFNYANDIHFALADSDYHRLSPLSTGSADVYMNSCHGCTIYVDYSPISRDRETDGGIYVAGGMNGPGVLDINGGNISISVNQSAASASWMALRLTAGPNDSSGRTAIHNKVNFHNIENLDFTLAKNGQAAQAYAIYSKFGQMDLDVQNIRTHGDTFDSFLMAYKGTKVNIHADIMQVKANEYFVYASDQNNQGRFTNVDFTIRSGQMDGNIGADKGASVQLSLLADGRDLVWSGFATTDHTTRSQVSVALTNNARWNVTSNSTLTNLEFLDTTQREGAGSSIVDLSSKRSNTTYTKLESQNLTANNANATVVMEMDILGDSDQLLLGSATGQFQVQFVDLKNANADTKISKSYFASQNNGILTIMGSDGETVATDGAVSPWHIAFLTQEQKDQLDSGTLELKDLTNTSHDGPGYWYLAKESSGSENPETPEVDDNLQYGSTIAQAISWWSEKNDLRRRLGEVRYGTQAGAWAKVFHRKDTADGFQGHTFEQKVSGVHVGYDTLLGTSENSTWLIGGTFRYAYSKQNGMAAAGGGSGNMDEYSLKAYFVWTHDSGWYIDPLVQVGWYDQNIEGIRNSGTGRFTANYGVWGAGTSIEIGKMISFCNDKLNDRRWFNHWFIEPQAELSYFNIEGANYTTSTGLKVHQDGSDYLTGRLGFALGKKFNYATQDSLDRRFFQIALTGGVTKEFLGENRIHFTGTDGRNLKRTQDLDETRFYYGIVWDWQFDLDKRFYGEIERESGDHYRKDYSVTLGLKWVM